MARMKWIFAHGWSNTRIIRISDSIHPQTLSEYQTSIFNAFFLWHDVCPQHMSRQRIHSGFPTLKFPQVLGFELGQKTHKKIMGFYGIITGKLWVFTGSGKTWFLGNYGFLWEDYGFGHQNPLFFDSDPTKITFPTENPYPLRTWDNRNAIFRGQFVQ